MSPDIVKKIEEISAKETDKVKKMRMISTLVDGERDKELVTPENIVRHDDIPYGPVEKWNLLDVYYPKDTISLRPVIVSIHGGGWVYGTKEVYQYYCMNLAQRGFTVINFNYRLAPEYVFPSSMEDVNRVFCWIAEHGKEYFADKNQVFVVGDSAGAQLASQYLAFLTNEKFQRQYAFNAPSGNVHVRAVGLNCGVYDTRKLLEEQDDMYTLSVGEKPMAKMDAVDTVKYITPDFPPAYIMTSSHDFLKEYARPMYDLLVNLGIRCEYRLYANETEEPLGHVFHLDIRSEAAEKCNEDECRFFRQFLN